MQIITKNENIMYLFFDTETTGLPINWKAPVKNVNNWPRMVQIAWLLYDANRNRIDEKEFIIKPEGFSIPDDATRVHGISTECAMDKGQDLDFVLKLFAEQIETAGMLVAHNMSFDEKIVGAEFIRKNIPNKLFQTNRICTMKESTGYCRIPGHYGYKWPKLSELHIELFGEDFEEAHNAAVDINATAKCFWKMKELEII
jgi:DNA polymerase III subunit epsilon